MLSFSSTVGQNGEPSAFSCRDNIVSQQNKAGERQKRWDWRWNYKILPPIPTVKLKKTVRACQQTTEQNNDANGGGQSPNSSNTGRWDSVSKAQYVKTKQIFLMKSNISCQKASKLLTIICISLIVCTSIIVTCRETTNHKKSFHRLKLQLSSQGKFTFGN